MTEEPCPFVIEPRCRKCWSAELKYAHQDVAPGVTEALELECERCGFAWLMRCADDPQGAIERARKVGGQ
jgi:hypothetical protein